MENLDRNTYNEIDKFIQNKLNKEVLVDEKWNTPTEQVLDDALNIVNSNTGRTRKKYWFLLLLCLSGGSLFLVIWNSVVIHRMQQQMETIYEDFTPNTDGNQNIFTQEKKNKADRLGNQAGEHNASNTVSTNAKKIEVSSNKNTEIQTLKNAPTINEKRNEIVKKDILKNNTNSRKLSRSINSTVKKENVKLVSNKAQKLIPIEPNNSLSDEKDYKYINKQTNNSTGINEPVNSVKQTNSVLSIENKHSTFNKHNFTPVSLLPFIKGNLENTIENQLLVFQNSVDDIPLNTYYKQSKYWTVYLLFGANYTKQRMTNLPENIDFTLLEYDKNCWGFESGIGVKYQLTPRLNTNVTLSFSRINNNSVYEDQAGYNPKNEVQNDDGTVTYKGNYAVQTTMVGYKDQYNFEVSDANIAQVDNKTNIEQICQFYNTSFGLEYSLLSRNKLKVNIGTGAGLSYLKNATQHLDVNISNGGRFLFEDNITIASTKEMNRFSAFGLGTCSINYPITPKIDLGLYSQYSLGLTSIRKISNLNDPKTFNESFRIFFTAEYHFK